MAQQGKARDQYGVGVHQEGGAEPHAIKKSTQDKAPHHGTSGRGGKQVVVGVAGVVYPAGVAFIGQKPVEQGDTGEDNPFSQAVQSKACQYQKPHPKRAGL